MDTQKVITLARKHVDNNSSMESSARICLTDAINLYDKGEYSYAKQRALKSLAYSVGVFHADYKRASK